MKKFIDLFAGIGGFHVALKDKGLQCVFASEIDKAASKAYEFNFKHKPVGDICEIDNESIPSHDILCAGFPCQPFSISGKRGGLNDDRGRLFYEIVRIAKFHKPSVLLLENVKTILTIDGGNVQREIYKKLNDIGYRVKHIVLNASEFGIPQSRQRAYFVAVNKNSPLYFEPPKPNYIKRFLSDIMISNDKCQELIVERNDIVIEKSLKQNKRLKPIRIGYLNKGGQGERIYSTQGHAITLSANGGGVGNRTGLYYVDGKVRRLHIDEAKQVMGFGKKHQVGSGLSGYRQLGNAVIPEMIGHVFDGVRAA